MSLNFTLETKDYIAFNLYHTYHSPSLKKMMLAQKFIPLLVFVIAPVMAIKVTQQPPVYWGVVFGLVSIIWLIRFPKYFERNLTKRLAKMIGEGKNQGLFDPKSMVINEEGIHLESLSENSHTRWQAIEKMVIDKDHIYLYNSAISAFIIPKSAFEDEKACDDFLEEAKGALSFLA